MKRLAGALAAVLSVTGAAPLWAQNGTSLPLIHSVRSSTHTVFLNPRFVDAEVDGSLRVKDLIDVSGFLSVVPRSQGYGGTHYGELRSSLRLVKAGSFAFGPAHEHVGLTRLKDFEKLGVAGRFNGPRGSNFTFEAYVWASSKRRNNLGITYGIPIASGWRVTGFFDYLVRLPRQPKVLKATLRHNLPGRLEFMTEFFHSELGPRRERNKISAGIGIRLK